MLASTKDTRLLSLVIGNGTGTGTGTSGHIMSDHRYEINLLIDVVCPNTK